MLAWILCVLAHIPLIAADNQQTKPGVVAKGTTPLPAPPLVDKEPVPPDLSKDARLTALVTLEAKSQTLDDCLQHLREQTGLHLRAAEEIGQRRITLFAERQPLRNVMQAIMDTVALDWRAGVTPKPNAPRPNSAPAADTATGKADSIKPGVDYELYRTPARRNHEEFVIAESEKRAKWALNMQREHLLSAVRNAKGPFAGLLSQLDAQQLERACNLAAQPTGPISSSSNSHVYDHLMNVRPFAELSPAMQSDVRRMLNQPETIGSGDNALHLKPALDNAADLDKSSIGLVAAEGGLSLAVVQPDGKDVWVSRDNAVRRGGINGVDSDDDSVPEVTEQMAQSKLLDLAGVPTSIRHKKLRFPVNVDRAALPELLHSLAQQTGLSLVSDDFLRSRRTVYYWVLTDKPEYGFDEACEQIAKAYGHRMIYKEGVLRAQTVSPGLDMRIEPPSDVIARLRDLTAKKLSPGLNDFAMVGRLTREQLDSLMMAHFPGVVQGSLLLYASRAYDALHFYATLPPALRGRAESKDGLPARDLNARQKEAFIALQSFGLMLAPPATEKNLRPGLYVRHQEADEKLSAASLVLVSEDQPPRMLTQMLTPAVRSTK